MVNVTPQNVAGGEKATPVGTDTVNIQETGDGSVKYATLTNIGNAMGWTGGGAVDQDHIDTTETIGSTGSYVDLTTVGPSVTLTTGTRVRVTISCDVKMTTSFTGNTAFMSFAVSGASTLAADEARAVWINGHSGFDTNFNIPLERTFVIEGLTAGSNTFTAKFKKDGQNWSFGNRRIMVEAL